jgi:hypothetical protein
MNITDIVYALKEVAILQIIQLGIMLGLMAVLGIKDQEKHREKKMHPGMEPPPNAVESWAGFSHVSELKRTGRLPLADHQGFTPRDVTKQEDPGPLTTYEGLRRPDQPDNRWHRICDGPLPVQIEIDLKIKDGEGTRIVKKARMVSKRPLKFRPDFLKYKSIIAWRFSE